MVIHQKIGKTGCCGQKRRSNPKTGSEANATHFFRWRNLSWSTTDQAASAFSVLYRVALKGPQDKFAIARRKTPARL